MKNIDSDLIRGNIDTIILKTMLDGDKYGLDIIKEVEARSNGTYELKQPTLYSCLKRLENQELISSYWLDSDIGGKRHYYKLTEKGRDFFKQKQEEWSKSKFIIDNLLSNFNDDEYRLVKKDDYDRIIEGKTFNYDEHKMAQALKNYEDNIGKPENASDEENEEISEETTNIDEEDELGINEYNKLLEESDEEDNSVESTNDENDEDIDEDVEDNSPVYVSSNIEVPDQDDEDDNANIDVNDVLLSEHEKNLLSKLRFHDDDDDITTYYGDKNSYINHLNLGETDETEEDDENEDFESEALENEIPVEETSDEDEDLDNLVAVQQNLLDDPSLVEQDEFESKVNEFSQAAHELQNFDSSGKTTKTNEFDYDIPEPNEIDFDSQDDEENEEPENLEIEDSETEVVETETENADIENDEISQEETDETENFDDYISFENEQPVEETVEENINETNQIQEITEVSNEYQNNVTTFKSQEISDIQDDFFDELDELKDNSRSSFISGSDDSDYNESEVNKEIANFTQSETYNKEQEEDNFTFENDEVSNENEQVSDDFYYNETEEPENDFSAFDNIITQNADTYSQANMFSETENHQLFVPTIQPRPEPEKPKTDEESLNKAKDINALKEEFELQGIKVKEFKKYTEREEAAKNYLLVNKINLVASLILLFGYVFILSAVYIIMNNTSLSSMTGFNFISFVYGFIPFAVLAIYNIIKFVANPYKKVPAKYSPGVTIFIAIIITVQLLLITYCVNLQLGFYSFAQASYNHLLWIIPAIISFSPIVSNLVYIALFYSQNFNV